MVLAYYVSGSRTLPFHCPEGRISLSPRDLASAFFYPLLDLRTQISLRPCSMRFLKILRIFKQILLFYIQQTISVACIHLVKSRPHYGPRATSGPQRYLYKK